MRYEKAALTFEEQADLLIHRGLQVDRGELITYLSRINYYYLSGYLYPFRLEGSDNFVQGTSLDLIKQRVEFDSDLRLLIMKAIERIELGLFRTQLVEHLTLQYGPFCYLDSQAYKDVNIYPEGFVENLMGFSAKILKAEDTEFIKRYRNKYTDENFLPFWMIVEKMSFGQLSYLFNNLRIDDRSILAEQYGVHYKILSSWLHTLTFTRNICAHYGRLWKRYLPVKPKIPDNVSGFHNPVQIDNSNIFGILVILQYLLNVLDPDMDWGARLQELIVKYPLLPIGQLGLPDNWDAVPFWRY